MPTPDQTIDHGTLRRLIGAGAHVDAEVIGASGGWGVRIHYAEANQTLAVTRGTPRTFRQFETLVAYLKRLGITEYRVDASEFAPASASIDSGDRRSAVASERMKRAHDAAAYDAWFKEQVQTSLDDPRPSVADEEVKAHFAVRREALRKRSEE